jgi:hypothetical protein
MRCKFYEIKFGDHKISNCVKLRTFLTAKQFLCGPGQALMVPGGLGFQILRRSSHEGCKVVSHTHRPSLPSRRDSWYSFLLDAVSIPGHRVAGRIMSMKNSNDNIGDRTRDLPACSAVPQPTAPPRAP